jgi:hypothetical protein
MLELSLKLRRLNLATFHVEHSLRATKEIGLRLQRRQDQLAIEAANLIDELHQMRAIELGSGVIQQQSRSRRSSLLQELNLRQGHRNRDKFLLPTREYLPRGSPTDADEHICAMGAAVRQSPGLIPRTGID